MKPLPVEMACLLGIQNEIQAVWFTYYVRVFFGFFESPTYVRTFSVHNVREYWHFLNHLLTPISLRNS